MCLYIFIHIYIYVYIYIHIYICTHFRFCFFNLLDFDFHLEQVGCIFKYISTYANSNRYGMDKDGVQKRID